MKSGIIICSRLSSKRIPQKAIIPLAGKPALYWLLLRLKQLSIPTVIATPYDDFTQYRSIFEDDFPDIKFFKASEKNVLERLYQAAYFFEFDPVIRITHDDLLIDTSLLKEMLSFYESHTYKYLSSSQATDGIAAEIISLDKLKEAYEANSHINIEHISYFVKNKKDDCFDFIPKQEWQKKRFRLTLDYPNDYLLLSILSGLTNFMNPEEVVSYLDSHRYLCDINDPPKITVFISCFNGEKYLREAIESIRKRSFRDFELLFVDDGSSDQSLKIAASYDDIKIIVNTKNEGIAFSSNRALERAKGKYIMRLDSDDLLHPYALEDLYNQMEANPTWAIIYSGYYEVDEKLNILQKIDKNVSHHIAGSLMSKKAINEIKFRNGLKHFDSQEIYTRILNSFSYGYLEQPLFYYRKHENSWSRKSDNLKIRAKIKRELKL